MGNDIGGSVASGLDAVLAEFERNFAERGEIGAAFAVARDGDLIVDLWGGLRDRGSNGRWERDTLQLIFSGTKALVAICVLLLIERNQLELEVWIGLPESTRSESPRSSSPRPGP